MKSTLVYYENVNVVYLFTNPIQHQRMKHVEIDLHFISPLRMSSGVAAKVFYSFPAPWCSPSYKVFRGLPLFIYIYLKIIHYLIFNAHLSNRIIETSGLNCAEAVNFAPADWLTHDGMGAELYRLYHKAPVLSHEELLYVVANVREFLLSIAVLFSTLIY
jgi:hypothetical protein